MNTKKTSKNIFTYIKTHYGEIILAKKRKLEKTMKKYSSHSKILPKDLQLESKIKTEQSKMIL